MWQYVKLSYYLWLTIPDLIDQFKIFGLIDRLFAAKICASTISTIQQWYKR